MQHQQHVRTSARLHPQDAQGAAMHQTPAPASGPASRQKGRHQPAPPTPHGAGGEEALELDDWQWLALQNGDHGLLLKYQGADYDYNLGNHVSATPLIMVMDKYVFKATSSEKEKFLDCFKWLLKKASPLGRAPANCTFTVSYQKKDQPESKTKRVSAAGKNALQMAYEIKDSIPTADDAWTEERRRIREVIGLLGQPDELEEGEQINVPEGVVDLWSALLEEKETADVEVKLRDGASTRVHSLVLRNASDFFDAMLTHDMLEKQTKSVEMLDIALEDFEELMGLVYTGCWSEDPTVERILEILTLADRYSVTHIQEMLLTRLQAKLSFSSFESIFRYTLCHACPQLRAMCHGFAAGSHEIKQKFLSEEFSPEVMCELRTLFGMGGPKTERGQKRKFQTM